MTIRRRVILLLGSLSLVAACGGGTAIIGGGDGGPDAMSATDSGVVTNDDGGSLIDASRDAARDANPSECPSTFRMPPGHCTVGLSCAYDQGRCECEGYCGGPPPPPDTDFSHWTCTPKVDNGCPDTRPQTGDPCKIPASSCTYGSCCVETFLCGQSGKFTSGGVNCPP